MVPGHTRPQRRGRRPADREERQDQADDGLEEQCAVQGDRTVSERDDPLDQQDSFFRRFGAERPVEVVGSKRFGPDKGRLRFGRVDVLDCDEREARTRTVRLVGESR